MIVMLDWGRPRDVFAIGRALAVARCGKACLWLEPPPNDGWVDLNFNSCLEILEE